MKGIENESMKSVQILTTYKVSLHSFFGTFLSDYDLLLRNDNNIYIKDKNTNITNDFCWKDTCKILTEVLKLIPYAASGIFI